MVGIELVRVFRKKHGAGAKRPAIPIAQVFLKRYPFLLEFNRWRESNLSECFGRNTGRERSDRRFPSLKYS